MTENAENSGPPREVAKGLTGSGQRGYSLSGEFETMPDDLPVGAGPVSPLPTTMSAEPAPAPPSED